jgi:hypothetical protein
LLAVPPPPTANARRELCSRLVSFAERWFDIPVGSVCNPKRRHGNISKARFALAHVLADTAGLSEPNIAREFGCNASSINDAKRRARELLRTDAVFFDAVERLQKQIEIQ